jgi:hypothetical protein
MIKNSSEIEAKPEGIPGDPIRYHMPDRMPCFQNPNCVGLQGDENCTDAYCWTQPWVNQTNKDGKAIAYFGTGSHGGDNFSFRASGYWDGEKTDCLKVARNEIFTVKRKMFIEYRIIQSQTDRFRWKNCSFCRACPWTCGFVDRFGEERYGKYIGEYKIHPSTEKLLSHIQGVFDDCFIELYFTDSNAPVESSYYNHVTYGLSEGEHMGFSLNPLDTVLLAGVDHVACITNAHCMTGCGGFCIQSQYLSPDWEQFAYIARGNAEDSSINDYLLYERINRSFVYDIDQISLLDCSHELAHAIGDLEDDDDRQGDDYGLMVYDNYRYFLNSSNILLMRSLIYPWDYSDY